MVFFVPCLSLHNLNKLICAMMLLLSYRRDDAATINRIVRRQATGIEGQRKGVSNHLQNCTNEFEIFIDPMTTHATIHGDRRTQHIFFLSVWSGTPRELYAWHTQHVASITAGMRGASVTVSVRLS